MSEENKNLSSGQRAHLKNLLDGVDEQPEPDATADSTPGEADHSDFQIVPGDMVGPFKILSLIGRGGFGIVYLAEQTAPVRRRVALKVIKAGMDTEAIVARFDVERQALALMNHPAIARVYEAGATNQGRPYFAMEYVKGDPITEYCDTNKLDMRTRLGLFAQVCDAIRHAHLKGIIHRDLKPGNILVTIDDHDEPHPKVIDFGIAKATSQQLTERTLFTQQGQVIGTPEFMSPEQAEMTGVDVDTRTDVYSLGVILYVLVSGHLPFDSKRLREKGFPEIQRIIREEDPPRPSTRVTSASEEDGENTRRIAKARQTSIESLSSTLRRELEWIPLKALRKDRTERYSSVEAFGEDVRRYLRGDALEAGPESSLYRLRKMMRRHKGPFITAALIALSLLAGIVGTTIFALRSAEHAKEAEVALAGEKIARTEAARHAKLVSETALSLFGPVAAKLKNLSGATEAREVLVSTGFELLEELQSASDDASDPELLGKMALGYEAIGDLLGGRRTSDLGRQDEALEQYDQAESLWRLILERDPDSVDAEFQLALVLNKRADLLYEDDPDAALELLEESRRINLHLFARFPERHSVIRNYYTTLERVADALLEKDQFAQALELCIEYRDLASMLHEGNPDNTIFPRDLAMALRRIGYIKNEQSQPDEAEPALRRSLELMEAISTRYPNDERRKHDLALACWYLGAFLLERDGPVEAVRDEGVQLLIRCSGQLVSGCALQPDDADYRRSARVVIPMICKELERHAMRDGAIAVRRDALLRLQPVVEANPENLALAEVVETIRIYEVAGASVRE